MKLFANHFYNFGLNITHIIPRLNSKNSIHKDLYKAPSHRWEKYRNYRQSIDELHSFDWSIASGLGLVLGFDKIRALDIDGCDDFNLIDEFLHCLDLPVDYEWVVRSGSNNGFHIIFYAEEHGYPTTSEKIKAFKPNKENQNKFKHIELRWVGHLVLPPSQHSNNKHYKFINTNIPNNKPLNIGIFNLNKLVEMFCNQNESSSSFSGRYINSINDDPNVIYEKMIIDHFLNLKDHNDDSTIAPSGDYIF